MCVSYVDEKDNYHITLLSIRVITGGADKTAVVFDKSTEQVISTLKGHTRKVTHALYHPVEVSIIYLSSQSFTG